MEPKPEQSEYWKFTGPHRMASAFHTLHGITQGIIADDVLRKSERDALRAWLNDHADVRHKEPLTALCSVVEVELLGDSPPDQDMIDEVRETCDRLCGIAHMFDPDTADKQRLHGFVSGVAADKQILLVEVERLRDWLNEHEHLTGYWPFDEISATVRTSLADGRIDDEEQAVLLALFSSFTRTDDVKALDIPFNEMHKPIFGVCAHTPSIVFAERSFCVSGTCDRGPKSALYASIEEWGGIVHRGVLKGTDYLVVGAGGNGAWAYECYGRKVEKAMQMRKEGASITIVHEFDFWDAVEDAG